MTINHTPAPWTAVENVVLQRGNKIDREVAVCNGAIDEPTDDANARLCAAAPELLAALRQARAYAWENEKLVAEIDAAIDKACGPQ